MVLIYTEDLTQEEVCLKNLEAYTRAYDGYDHMGEYHAGHTSFASTKSDIETNGIVSAVLIEERRDGKLIVIDGDKRIIAAKDLGIGFPALVYKEKNYSLSDIVTGTRILNQNDITIYFAENCATKDIIDHYISIGTIAL